MAWAAAKGTRCGSTDTGRVFLKCRQLGGSLERFRTYEGPLLAGYGLGLNPQDLSRSGMRPLCGLARHKGHIRHMLDATEPPDYRSAHIPHRRQAAFAAAGPLRNDSHVMALRTDRKD